MARCVLASLALLVISHPAAAQSGDAASAPEAQSELQQKLAKARELNDEGAQFYSSGEPAKALSLLAEALRLRREVLGERHRLTLTSLNNYAFMLLANGQADEAEPLFAKAVQLRREVLGERDTATLTSLGNYAAALHALGRFQEAERAHLEAFRLHREVFGERHPKTLSILDSYARVVNALGRPDEAEMLYAQALSLRAQVLGESHRETLRSLGNYAEILQELGRFDEAEPLFADALRLSREAFGQRHPDTLSSLSGYAGILFDLGRFAEAEPLYSEALRLRRDTLGASHPYTLTDLSNYASVLLRLGRAEEAERLDAGVLRLSREVLGERHPDTLNRMSNRASVLKELGRLDEAASVDAETLRLRREVLGERHPDTVISLHNYAVVLASLGRTDEAEPFYARSAKLFREVFGENHPRTLFTLRNYASFQLETGRSKEVLGLSRELVSAYRARDVELSQDRLRGEEQRGREFNQLQMMERFHSEVLWSNHLEAGAEQAELSAEAFQSLQVASAGSPTKAVAEAAATRFAASAGLQELVNERKALTRQWAALEQALVKAQAGGQASASRRASARNQLQTIEAQVAAIDTRLEVEAPQYFTIRNPEAIGLDSFRAFLGDDEAALLLVPTPLGTHSLAVTRETLGWSRSLLGRDEIAEAVEVLRLGLEIQADEGFLPEFDLGLAYELYTDLIEPIEYALEGKSRVYIVADGALSRLPLGTLLASAPPEGADWQDPAVLRGADWLADRYALVQLPSLQSLAYIRSFGMDDFGQSAIGFTGFGAPVLEGKAHLRAARSARLAPVDALALVGQQRAASGLPLMNPAALRKLAALPGTASELEQVRASLGASEQALFLADRMTERSIRSIDLSATRILHLATHGFTSEESGETAEPGLVFTPPDKAKLEDDGYLAASEVVGLDLTLAEWVILSACNTASPSGKRDETGLSGLAKSFFYAGAKSLLVSHWPVFDDIAPRLTVATLKRSQNGVPKAEALQAAMREIREDPGLDAAHPAVWAPFTLVGEGA